ncbi:hypothetical protein BC834DRAFT_828113 [Gloeopeniophorella convolvens]|nr:hypothetical protein BC834DRAFT_828113 [Gloeopeniophorella convolvens]
MASAIILRADEHVIKSVNVFKSGRADITRFFNISLKPGQSKVQISRLPSSIDTESVRVSGLGNAQLFDVVCSIGRGTGEINPQSTSEAIRKLHVKKSVLAKKLDVLDSISNIMEGYSKSLIGDFVGPKQADAHFERLLTRADAIVSVRSDLEEEIFQLSRQLNYLSTEMKKRGKTDGEVTVVIMTEQSTTVELKLAYLVHDATWSPAYELHATMAAGVPASSVSLHYRSRITQSTGEDWTDVALTLSTADTNLSSRTIPTLNPTRVRPPPWRLFSQRPTNLSNPPVSLFGQSNTTESSSAHPNQSPLGSAPTNTAPSTSGQPSVPGNSFGGSGGPAFHFAPPPTVVAAFSEHLRNPTILQQQQQQQQQPPVAVAQSDTAQAPEAFSDWKDLSGGAITESTFVMHESPLVALTYPVEGVSSIPSDGVPHKVSVAVLPLEAKIAYVTVPKVQPVAYLHASIKNASDYHLLSGSVNAFVNDSFVSKSTITKDIVPGDVFSCALGSDLSTRIRYSRTTKRAPMSEGSFSISTTTTYVSRTTVTNKHSFPLRPFVLRDGVPTSDDKSRVRVVLRRPAGLAELNQEKEGSAQAENPKDKKTTVRWSKVTDGKGGRKEGLFEWVFEVGAGEEVTVETEWDVNAYSSLVWVDVEGVQARDTLVTKNAQDQGCTSQ